MATYSYSGTSYVTVMNASSSPVFVNFSSNQEIDYNGEHWKTEEAISIDPADGTSAEYRRARDTFALAQSRLQSAASACAAIGAGLYALRPPLEDTGIVIGEIEAWRAWRGNKDNLHSVAHDFAWSREGVTQSDQEPKEDNSSGLWAFKTREGLDQNFPFDVVKGRVKLWGKIVEHEFGYRAQYAKIEELFGMPSVPAPHSSFPIPTKQTSDPFTELAVIIFGAVFVFAILTTIALA